MGNIRKGYRAAFKAKVALEAAKKVKTIVQLSSEYGVPANQPDWVEVRNPTL